MLLRSITQLLAQGVSSTHREAIRQKGFSPNCVSLGLATSPASGVRREEPQKSPESRTIPGLAFRMVERKGTEPSTSELGKRRSPREAIAPTTDEYSLLRLPKHK